MQLPETYNNGSSNPGNIESADMLPANNITPNKFRSFISTGIILLLAPLIAITLTVFVFQSYEVDGESMETTLQNNDRLIVYKVPRTIARMTGHNYIPNRGDVIVFVKHDLGAYGDSSSDKQLIKRVIGLPGDYVVVKDGSVTVYNAENPSGFSPDQISPYGKVITTTPRDTDLTVNTGEVFILGDNRTNSLDSRWFGAIPAQDIVGKLVVRIFPVSNAKIF